MASEQWLLNDTSVANNAYFTAVGSSYKLRNVSGGTHTRRTTSPTPYEGAGYYASGLANEGIGRFYTSGSVQLTGSVKYVDSYFYLENYPSVNVLAFVVTGDDTNVGYTYIQISTTGRFQIASFDLDNESQVWVESAASALPLDEWFRIQYATSAKGLNDVRLFKGANINGTTPDATLTKDFTAQSPFSGFGAYEYEVFAVDNTGGSPAILYADNIKFDDAAYPTRSTAHTADAAGSATATGTAAMSNARTLQATASGTATGTAAASNQRTLAASASATASGTAAMSSTQAMFASGSVTASGTAAADVTSVVTVDASATVTASGTASMSSTQAMSASATITATGLADGSIRPLVTVDGAGTITATGTTTFNKSQALAASASATASATASLIAIQTIAATASVTATATATLLITTPGSLYGNATKVAGLYGSSTKPTLTTRS